ncbi:MAG: cytochrome b N-terminal domain-containing protein [Pirellulales bacterium]
MIKSFLNWFDDRTGYRDLMAEALYENVPGGARWRYVWGSTLVFAFMTQLVTGLFLWMSYSPSSQTAWESVYYIQHEMQGGWLLRGIHHFTAQAMIVLLALHLWQVVVDGAYKAPREVNFWLGLILLKIVLGLSLTGYLLPWDQKGYWATQVATGIMGLTPVVGEQVQEVVVGGKEYGHQTLTRFFALHAGVLPGALMFFLALHIYVFRRHGLHYKAPKIKPDGTFWPDQILKDAVACLATLLIVMLLVWKLGAELGAPADPANPYSAARPEWYFLFLFQFLKFFPGKLEALGAIYIPGLVMGLLFLMPIVGRWKLGHRFNVALLVGILCGAGVLTALAMREDSNTQGYRNAVWEAHERAQLAEVRAAQGIPATGAAEMMRNDPRFQAFTVITQQCLGCHAYTDANGHGFRPTPISAPNLHGFASREWIEGLLDPKRIVSDDYFGATAMKEGDMVSFVHDDLGKLEAPNAVQAVALALSVEADHVHAEADQPLLELGRKILADDSAGCAQCHEFHGAGSLGAAPSLTDYGSKDWIIGMIADPNHEQYYQHLFSEDAQDNKQLMPSFGLPDSPEKSEPRLTDETIVLIAEWLRGEWPKPGQHAVAHDAADAAPAPAVP